MRSQIKCREHSAVWEGGSGSRAPGMSWGRADAPLIGEQDSGTGPRAWKEGAESQQLRRKEKGRQNSLVCDSEFTRKE